MTDPVQIRAGDLTAEHIGWTDHDMVIVAIHPAVLIEWHDGYLTSHRVEEKFTLSPPAPIRRRITWADLREHPPKDWDGANVVGTNYIAALTPHPQPRLVVDFVEHLITDDFPKWIVIDVPQGHALAECGEDA